jgi:hypothetical protein
MSADRTMQRVQAGSALLLSIPLLAAAVNHVTQWVKPPMPDGSPGAQAWELIRAGGLMDWLAAGHLAIGVMLLVPRTRFAAGLMQLPVTLGIVAFNATMYPRGVPLALGMLVVNLAVVLRPRDLRRIAPPDRA